MNINDYKIDFNNKITSGIYTGKIFDSKKQSFEKFLKLGLPTKKWESWRHTNLSKLHNLKLDSHNPIRSNSTKYKNNIPPIEPMIDLVIYNGIFRRDLSSELPQGVSISDDLEKLLKEDNYYIDTPFSLLNSTFLGRIVKNREILCCSIA